MIPRPNNVDRMRTAWRVANDITPRTSASWRITNEANPKIYVYDVIGGWDLDAATFIKDLNAIDATAIDMHISSPGGFVYDAIPMYEALKDHAAAVNVKIDGLAASAASFLAMAGDSIEIAKPGRMMIHDAQILAYGSPADLREAADLGDSISNDIAGIYAGRAGGTTADWRTAMQATTWYSSDQAVTAKLADKVKSGNSNSESDNRSRLIRARARVTLGGK